MNPKSVNDLDPKLKEAYERIMGTNFTPAAPTSASSSAPEQSATPNQNIPIMKTEQVAPVFLTTQDPNPSNSPFSQAPEPPLSVFTQSGPVSAPQTQKKKMNVLPILLVVGGIIFFGAYIVICAKIFGLF